MKKTDERVKKLTVTAMLCAMAFIIVAVCRIPIMTPPFDFLKYEPKDVIITLGGLIYGPLTSFLISAVVSLIEMITVSTTGYWGMLMNIISTCTFACVASLVYKKKKNLSGLLAGVLLGCVCSTAAMCLWNYFVTPIYMGMAREAIAELLLPVFMPFNLFKSALNAAIVFYVYKPAMRVFYTSKVISHIPEEAKKKNILIWIVAGLLLVACAIILYIVRK